MGEERYWIVHTRAGARIYRDAGGHPARLSVYRRVSGRKPVDDLVARITAEARSRGNVALFRDHWEPRAWGETAPHLSAAAGPLADAFRPRPLPLE